jgi:Fe2+ or Zn2+ uptake regulation protein
MDKCDAVTTLRRHGIPVTGQRKKILAEIHSLDGIFTAASLKESVPLDGIDEATIFRTLSLFLEQRIIRSVGTSERGQLFEKNCEHNPSHGHFRCTVCGTWLCLPPFSGEERKELFALLPKKIVAESVSLVFQGVCPLCSGEQDTSGESALSPRT